MNSQQKFSIFSSTYTIFSSFSKVIKQSSVYHIKKLTNLTQKFQPNLENITNFYQNHKQIILISSAVALTYYFTKSQSKKQNQQKQKNKKSIAVKKIFISDVQQQGNQLPIKLTGVRTAQSSEKQPFQKQKNQKIVENLSESQVQNEKIFFEMYKTYKNA